MLRLWLAATVVVLSSQRHSSSTTPTDGSGEHARPWRQAWAAVPDHNPRSEQDVHIPGLQQGGEGDVGGGAQETADCAVQSDERCGGREGGMEGKRGGRDGGEGVGRWRQRFMYVTYLVLFL